MPYFEFLTFVFTVFEMFQESWGAAHLEKAKSQCSTILHRTKVSTHWAQKTVTMRWIPWMTRMVRITVPRPKLSQSLVGNRNHAQIFVFLVLVNEDWKHLILEVNSSCNTVMNICEIIRVCLLSHCDTCMICIIYEIFMSVLHEGQTWKPTEVKRFDDYHEWNFM